MGMRFIVVTISQHIQMLMPCVVSMKLIYSCMSITLQVKKETIFCKLCRTPAPKNLNRSGSYLYGITQLCCRLHQSHTYTVSVSKDFVPGSTKVTETSVEKLKATRRAVNKHEPDQGAVRILCGGGGTVLLGLGPGDGEGEG